MMASHEGKVDRIVGEESAFFLDCIATENVVDIEREDFNTEGLDLFNDGQVLGQFPDVQGVGF